MNVADTAVLLVCAGNATRMGGIHKILHPLGKMTVLEHSLRTFSQCPSVTELVIICRTQDDAAFRDVLQKCTLSIPVTIAHGGATRQQSVKNGFAQLGINAAYIAIHDGARPLLTAEDAERVIHDAHVFGAATLGVPVKDTIKVVEDELILDTPPRSSLYQTQTPQVFRRLLYMQAMTFADAHGLDFTDDCQLVEAINIRVAMTTGAYENIKLTTPEDFAVAEALLMHQQQKMEAADNG